MIPTIENIVEGLMAGQYSKSQAVTWLHQHSEDALQDLRDYFAAKAMPFLTFSEGCTKECANRCYEIADAMLEARSK